MKSLAPGPEIASKAYLPGCISIIKLSQFGNTGEQLTLRDGCVSGGRWDVRVFEKKAGSIGKGRGRAIVDDTIVAEGEIMFALRDGEDS